jgi:hypothetical protein
MTTSKKIHRKSTISFRVPAILQVPQMIFRIVFFLGGKLLIAVNSHMQRNSLFMTLSLWNSMMSFLKGEMGSSE